MYNSRPWIGLAVDSALEQTVQDLEVIVVDDGSTDGGADVIRERATRDPRVRLLRQENRGPSAARNAGVAEASAPYVAFLDADDRWLPEKLERQLALAREGVVYADAMIVGDVPDAGTRISEHQQLFEGLVFDQLTRSNFVAMTTVLAPRELLRRYAFNEDIRLAEDLDLWLRLAADDVRFSVVREPLAEYRVMPDTPGRDSDGLNASRIAILRKVEPLVTGQRRELVRRRLAQERRVLAAALRRRALHSLASFDLRGAASSALASLRR
jgi:glycosyltransferase involved in cell wall biosynthesis